MLLLPRGSSLASTGCLFASRRRSSLQNSYFSLLPHTPFFVPVSKRISFSVTRFDFQLASPYFTRQIQFSQRNRFSLQRVTRSHNKMLLSAGHVSQISLVRHSFEFHFHARFLAHSFHVADGSVIPATFAHWTGYLRRMLKATRVLEMENRTRIAGYDFSSYGNRDIRYKRSISTSISFPKFYFIGTEFPLIQFEWSIVSVQKFNDSTRKIDSI